MSCHGYEGVMSVLCTSLQVKCYRFVFMSFQFCLCGSWQISKIQVMNWKISQSYHCWTLKIKFGQCFTQFISIFKSPHNFAYEHAVLFFWDVGCLQHFSTNWQWEFSLCCFSFQSNKAECSTLLMLALLHSDPFYKITLEAWESFRFDCRGVSYVMAGFLV